jgi:hypothetical protein
MEEFNPYNPYAAPKAENLMRESSAEDDRRRHINREGPIKAVGCLFIGWGAVMLMVMFTALIRSLASDGWDMSGKIALAFIFGIAAIFAGLGLRRFHFVTIVVATVLVVLASALFIPAIVKDARACVLLAFPGFILWLLWNQKSRRIFRADYQTVIGITPHVRGGGALFIWLILLLLIVGYLAIFTVMNY